MLTNKDKQSSCSRLGSVGGQALIEGIMMRGPEGMALSVRTPDGKIDTEMKNFTPYKEKHKILGVPFVRGVASYIESMVTGYKCLMESAEKSGLEDLEESSEPSKFEAFIMKHFGDKIMPTVTFIGSVLGILLAVFLFMWLPSFIFDNINNLTGEAITGWRAVIEGIMRIALFIGYIAAVSLMKDIRRTFEYHGAEHKSIFCYESGDELTVENVKKYRRFHPRCGTSFLFVIMIISIAVSSIVSLVTPLAKIRIVWVITKLCILPIVMAVGYEFIRYAGRHDNLFTKIASAPGLWMQRLTTKEPHDDQIEVAVAALKMAVGIVDEPEEAETDEAPAEDMSGDDTPSEAVELSVTPDPSDGEEGDAD